MILALSGGLDSTTLLAYYRESLPKEAITGVIFNYGSKHNQLENTAADKVADHYGIETVFMPLATAFIQFNSALLKGGEKVPEGHYNDETMKKTVVPGRNSVFLSLMAGLAASNGNNRIAIGVHAGDHLIYPDCRPEFIEAMQTALRLGTDNPKLEIVTPFLHKNKADIVAFGLCLKAPFHLTRTCYTSDRLACGKCGSCRERLEAFQVNGVKDPIEYQS